MQAIELFAPQPHANGVSKSSSLEVLSDVFRRSLRSIFEGDEELPCSAREGTSAALSLLEPVAGGGGFPLVHYQGQEPFFPGELVSVFYLAGLYLKMQLGELEDDEDLRRDVLRMVRARDADAANLILDRITDTLSGPALPRANLELFARRRGRLDALLSAIGVEGVRCQQKIWERMPYGRDAQLLGPDGAQDNRITAIATASLLVRILEGRVGEPSTASQIQELLEAHSNGASESHSQLRIAASLPAGSRVWGRRAVGSRLLHEAAAVELPSGRRYVLVFLSRLGERSEATLATLGRAVAAEITALG